jgi:hypothetical protein
VLSGRVYLLHMRRSWVLSAGGPHCPQAKREASDRLVSFGVLGCSAHERVGRQRGKRTHEEDAYVGVWVLVRDALVHLVPVRPAKVSRRTLQSRPRACSSGSGPPRVRRGRVGCPGRSAPEP